MAAKLSGLTYKIAIQLTGSFTICGSPETFGYTLVYVTLCFYDSEIYESAMSWASV